MLSQRHTLPRACLTFRLLMKHDEKFLLLFKLLIATSADDYLMLLTIPHECGVRFTFRCERMNLQRGNFFSAFSHHRRNDAKVEDEKVSFFQPWSSSSWIRVSNKNSFARSGERSRVGEKFFYFVIPDEQQAEHSSRRIKMLWQTILRLPLLSEIKAKAIVGLCRGFATGAAKNKVHVIAVKLTEFRSAGFTPFTLISAVFCWKELNVGEWKFPIQHVRSFQTSFHTSRSFLFHSFSVLSKLSFRAACEIFELRQTPPHPTPLSTKEQSVSQNGCEAFP
jgi:hypothetical protein